MSPSICALSVRGTLCCVAATKKHTHTHRNKKSLNSSMHPPKPTAPTLNPHSTAQPAASTAVVVIVVVSWDTNPKNQKPFYKQGASINSSIIS